MFESAVSRPLIGRLSPFPLSHIDLIRKLEHLYFLTHLYLKCSYFSVSNLSVIMCQVTGRILYQLTNFLSCAGFYESLPGGGELCHVPEGRIFLGISNQNSAQRRKHKLYTIQGHKVRRKTLIRVRKIHFFFGKGEYQDPRVENSILLTISFV